MIRFARAALCALIVASVAVAPLAAQSGFEWNEVTPGAHYARYRSGWTLAHILRVDLRTKGLRVRSVKGKGRERIRSMVSRVEAEGERVLGAINGDFFKWSSSAGVPFGLQICDGRLVFGPDKRSTIAFNDTNTPAIGVVELEASLKLQGMSRAMPIDSVNITEREVRSSSSVILYTPEFRGVEFSRHSGAVAIVDEITPALQVGESCSGTVTRVLFGRGETLPIPPGGCLIYFLGNRYSAVQRYLRIGRKVTLDIKLPPVKEKIAQAIGGGPRIVREGAVSVEFHRENFRSEQGYLQGTHPRSAVGYNRARTTLYLIVVEGRQSDIRGMRMEELAEFMIRLGCYEAMGFDGGGSASLWVGGQGIVSTSIGGSGPEERRIANSLLVTQSPLVGATKGLASGGSSNSGAGGTGSAEIPKPPVFRP